MKTLKIILLLTLLLSPQFCFALDIGNLINGAQNHNLQEVAIVGEAIGDIMKRGENSWINLSNGEQAIGVWAPNHLLFQIKFLGGYRFKGDTIQVRGNFHSACDLHGGDMDLHAIDLIVTEKGRQIDYSLNQVQLFAVFLLLGLLIVLLILRYKTLTQEQKT